MAIYHLSAGVVSRSSGRSAVQSGAYITGERLIESRRDLVANYRNRADSVLFHTTLFPKGTPAHLQNLDIWDKLESFEDHYAKTHYKSEATQAHYMSTAQTAQTIEVALPQELSPTEWQELITRFANDCFVSRGLIVTLAMHKDAGNPHAHLQVSRRSINEQGEFSWTKDREIMTKVALRDVIRASWAEHANLRLEQVGLSIRIDHRSYIEQGIPFTPTQHEGWFAHKLQAQGLFSRIIEENKAIRLENQTLAALEPACILDELCSKQATFSSSDLSKLVQNRVNDDATLHSIVAEESLRQAIPVGVGLDGLTRYSSPDYVAQEQEALGWVHTFATQPSALAIHPTLIDQAITKNPVTLNAEQIVAVNTLCAPVQLGTLIGRAGTGKTTTLQPVVECHKQAGYKTMGLCLSASAAENLGQEAHIEAETIAFYLDKWERLEKSTADYAAVDALDFTQKTEISKEIAFVKPYALSNRHLVIVDEAGMVGTRQWHAILRYAKKASAKVIAVGDDHQFKAIDAGDFYRAFRDIAKNTGRLCILKDIQRQREPWMKDASLNLAELKTQEALASYENHSLVEKVKSGTEGYQEIAARYVKKQLENPDKTSSLMAYTRADCNALNTEVRSILQSKGLVEPQEHVINNQSFAINDAIVFLKNDRQRLINTFDPGKGTQKKFLIKNGTQGRILSIERIIELESEKKRQDAQNIEQKPKIFFELTVAIHANTYARLRSDSYNQFSHAYATTLHKSQGRTVDWSMVLVSKYMDAYALYVALTRHRDSTTLFYDAQTFPNFKALQNNLSRLGTKDLSLDYSIHPAQKDPWNRVQLYKLLGQDLSLTAKEKNWAAHNALKTDRETLGKNILEDWDAHREFARQANLSFESIAIQSGLCQRPLSLAEQEAKKSVELYAAKALEARTLWKEINKTCPGTRCAEHAEYRAFTELRQERNSLAKTISEYPALHREFVQALGKTQGIGWKTLEAQAKQDINFALYDKAAAKTQSEGIPLNPLFAEAYTRYTADVEQTKAEQPHSQSTPKSFAPRDPRQIRSALEHNIERLALDLLGEPQRKTAKEWRYGAQGAISIAVAGTKQGAYANFAEGSFGGPCQLIQDVKGLDFKEAFQWGIAWLGPEKIAKPSLAPQKAPPEPNPWVPIQASTQHPLPKDLSQEPALKYQFTREQRQEVARYAYKDAEGQLLGYMVRLEDAQGKKAVLPLAYCQNAEGEQQWRWQSFFNRVDRSLYGLEKLGRYPDKPVLVVEGEKTADKAQKRFPDYVVVSWSGGTGATHKTDLSPLLGHSIALWPDNDEPGLRAMERISDQLLLLHQDHNLPLCLNTVAPAQDWPLKWDLGDPLPKGWSLQDLKDLLEPARGVKIALETPERPAKALTNQQGTRGMDFGPGGPTEALSPQKQQGAFPALSSLGNKPVAQISEILAQYGFRDLKLNEAFLEHSQARYNQMMHWQGLLGITPSAERQNALFEKAVLSEALRPLGHQRFSLLSSPLQAQARSESLALIAAKLLQDHGQRYSTEDYLKGAKAIFDQQQGDKATVFRDYQQLHPLSSDRTLQRLVEQSLLCSQHCNQLLNEPARLIVLQSIHHLESLEKQGKLQQALTQVLQTQSSGLNPESPSTVQSALEQAFIQRMSAELQSLRAGNPIEHRSPQAHLEAATHSTEQRYQQFAKEERRQIQEITKARALSQEKNQERER